MIKTTATQKNPMLNEIMRLISGLQESEKETLEMMLDEEFTNTVRKRGEEIKTLQKNNGTVSLAEMQNEFYYDLRRTVPSGSS